MGETLLQRLQRHAKDDPNNPIEVFPGDVLEIIEKENELLKQNAHALQSSLNAIKDLLTSENDYAISRGDKALMNLGEVLMIGSVMEKADEALSEYEKIINKDHKSVNTIEDAKRRALEIFENWNKVTGFVNVGESYYYEIQSVVEDAVIVGVQFARRDYEKLDCESYFEENK